MQFDKDLRSVQETRTLLKAARKAVFEMNEYDQQKVDRIVKEMADTAYQNAAKLAKMVVDETGFGRYEDKIIKNQFASKNVHEYIKTLKTVGIINRNEEQKTFDVAVAMGVVAGIIPSTNPTSTAIYKILIAVKSRNAIVLSPHPAAQKCIYETADLMRNAAEKAGAPKGLISCMTEPTLEGTEALFKSQDTAVILATGGSVMVRAAYASGRPAIGVGPGNVPAFIEKSADVPQAVRDIVSGKAFDYGLICASEQSAIVDRSLKDKAIAEFKTNKAFFCSAEEKKKLESLMVGPNFHLNTSVVGLPPKVIAKKAGFSVPDDTSILIVYMEEVGREDPLSFEKLSPVLCFYTVDNWMKGCERSIEILNYGGLGHTMAIHSNDEKIIEEFALYKPAFRIIVNSPSTHGAIGYSTNLPPALTLGPGSIGGASSSDNISPLHLMNLKHVAYGTRQVGQIVKAGRTEETRVTQQQVKDDDGIAAEVERRVLELIESNNNTSVSEKNQNSVSDDKIQRIIDEVRKNR